MRHRMKQLVGSLVMLALVLGLIAAISPKVYAYDGNPYTAYVNSAEQKVTFNGRLWYIIADNSTSPTQGTVTLFAADTSFGLSAFSDNDSNDYSSSKIKAALDAYTASGGAFANVAKAIETNNDAGGKLYLLSKEEIKGLSHEVLIDEFNCKDNRWWLRSPSGGGDDYVATVDGGNGQFEDFDDGNQVKEVLGVRPALKLNLSQVVFSSASKTFEIKGKVAPSAGPGRRPSGTDSDTPAASPDTDNAGTKITRQSDGTVTITDADLGTVTQLSPQVFAEGQVYRLYNSNTGEHFYTKNPEERDALATLGWNYEADQTSKTIASTEEGAAPVYRVYNPNSGLHHYTMSKAEALMLKNVGWDYEGISMYAFNGGSNKGTPTYRVYCPFADANGQNQHVYTTSKAEVQDLVARGYIDEGIAWNVK